MDTHAPPRRRGFTPSTWRMLDADISADAALLLLRLRRLADRDESDGYIEQRDLDALVAFHRLQKPVVRRSLAELIDLGLLERDGELYRDTEFSEVCHSAVERQHRREQWKASTNTYRNKSASASVSAADSSAESAHSPSQSPSSSVALSPAPAQTAAESSALETNMPRQQDEIVVIEVWEEIAGRKATMSEINHIAWWIDMLRLDPSQIAEVMRHIHTRETAKGNQINQLAYFDAALRDADASARPSRIEPEVRGENEPQAEQGAYLNGADRSEQIRGWIATTAATKRLS